MVRTLLGFLLALSVILCIVGAVLTARVVSAGYWGNTAESDVATTFLVGAAFLVGLCPVVLFPRVPYLMFLLSSVAWVLAGFFSLKGNFGHGSDFWWWPDVIFATGISNLVGGLIGFVISKFIMR